MSKQESSRTAIIIGAGPSGLTAAFELIERTDVRPIVLEKSEYMGGISRTINYKGNRIDIGGHRFFSKSDRVMNWWLKMMPMQALKPGSQEIAYQNKRKSVATNNNGPDPDREDVVMLVRPRKSRIYFMRQFFSYPLQLSAETLTKLGLTKTMKIGVSYMRSAMFPIKNEKSLEDFFINRFGRELYNTFFRSYTEKVWGVPCREISAEWGAQRIKGLSIWKTLTHMAKKAFPKKTDLAQKDTETSLIEQFLYPKFGPGQMWEEVAKKVTAGGGEILTGWQVDGLEHDGKNVVGVKAFHPESGERRIFRGDFYFSTMPVKELVAGLEPPAPKEVSSISDALQYRDFITVGLLCKKLVLSDPTVADGSVKDNWIYIQEPDVLVGRLQVFNNWSPHMVANPEHKWIGLEYFCYDTDDLWKKPDAEMIEVAKTEMERIGVLKREDVIDATVIRVEKTYPAYFGAYNRFDEVRAYVDRFENLFLVGRNGMHKYNNQDHSMLTAMMAVDNIAAGVKDKSSLWALNTEQEYHEEKQDAAKEAELAAGARSQAASRS